jgi:hypothetical protein
MYFFPSKGEIRMAQVSLNVECIVHSLNIRRGPNTSNSATGEFVMNGEVVGVTELNDDTGWYRLADGRGWISGGNSYVKVVENTNPEVEVVKTDTTTPPVETTIADVSTSVYSTGLDKKILDMLYNEAKPGGGKNVIDGSTRLFGGPHQFISQTDFRATEGTFQLGRKYMQTIVSEAPIVYFMPGKPNYLPDMDSDQRSAFTDFITGKPTDNKSIIDAIAGNKDYRYYSFIADYASYMRYVNLLCRFSSIYIGIGDSFVPGTQTKYKNYDWSNYRYESAFKNKDDADQADFFNLKELKTDIYNGLFGNYQYVQFCADPSLSFNESSSNNTAQSKVEGFFDTAEGVVKELAFLLDAGAINNNGDALQKFSGGVDTLGKELSGKNENFFSRLLGMSSNVLSGANMVFPQIWGDSAYNKSYNITVNLVSPYGDRESIFLNCVAPLMHLMALAMPRQSSANSYAAPFMVRAFAKGWFSCEMGIVDNITIEKGGQGAWTIDGLPSEIKVSLGIKDLYSNMMITPNSKPGAFFQNVGLIDFLAVTCGIDITKPQFQLQLDAILSTLTNAVVDIPRNWARDTVQEIRNRFEILYKLQ